MWQVVVDLNVVVRVVDVVRAVGQLEERKVLLLQTAVVVLIFGQGHLLDERADDFVDPQLDAICGPGLLEKVKLGVAEILQGVEEHVRFS